MHFGYHRVLIPYPMQHGIRENRIEAGLWKRQRLGARLVHRDTA